MKKIFAIFTVLAVFTLGLVLAGCPAGEEDTYTYTYIDPNADIIGTWRGTSSPGGSMMLEITNSAFFWVYGSNNATGYWDRNGESIFNLRCDPRDDRPDDRQDFGIATLSDGKLLLVITYYDSSPNGTYNLSKDGSNEGGKNDATLKIKNESFTELTEVTWNGIFFGTISTGGASVTKNVTAGTGYIYFTPKNSISARTQEIITVEKGDTKEITIIDNTIIVETNNTANTGRLGVLGVPPILKIKNESSIEITDVVWQGVFFANNQYENSIKTGTSVTQNVGEGAGYIFFKRKSNPITARTGNMVIIEKGGNVEFIFTDNTVIVEVNNTTNTGTLGALASTVVFFDDAEGEMQQYFERGIFFAYYDMSTALFGQQVGRYDDIFAVKNGNKSIAVGGSSSTKLHLKIDLTKPAKLSFWVANKSSSSVGTTFSINGELKERWTSDMDWSFKTYTLTAGQNDIIWEKKDGISTNANYSTCIYLSLDDILIYYTE